MKKLLFLLSVLFCFFYVNGHTFNYSSEENYNEVKMNKERVLRHIVVFKYKETATKEQVEKINKAFANLKNEIPQIRDFEWGLNNSPEGLDQDFTHCYMVTFHSEKDRDIYLPHPAHKAFVDFIGPYIEKVFVVDYWTED